MHIKEWTPYFDIPQLQSLKYNYFTSRNVQFVVCSNNQNWCHKNLDFPDVHVVTTAGWFLDEGYGDLALLSQCNHSIITVSIIIHFVIW